MSSPQKVLICRYRYDPLDRLTSHTLPDLAERHRFYCKSRLATEVQGAAGHSIVQHDDLLLAQQQRQNGVLDSTLLATDLQRSVLHTLKNDRQPQPIAYSPYGHRPAESGLSSLLGFNGERPDPVTGYYFLGNGYRAFNPVLMRFNSADSWSPFGKGGLNPYAYCLGDPINRNDPNGHVPTMYAFFKANRTLVVAPYSKRPTTWNIRPNITNETAKLAVTKINANRTKMSLMDEDIVNTFKHHEQHLYNPSPNQHLNLKNRAAQIIALDGRHDLSELPKTLIEHVATTKKHQNESVKNFYNSIKTKDYANQITFEIDRLADGEVSLVSNTYNSSTHKLAGEYQKRIADIRTSIDNLVRENDRIFNFIVQK
ncbi:RHS repeat-associated core domain-containing protein [Pseudomonas sp. NFX15]|uniref:RHS repeat-associated core domain-containing protein n=1 Tax=Pseudomonas sp. NFX15 TaxID=2816958 RepID=UPI003B8D4DA9